jgi:phosphate starvation-inducible PhoH-like protein
MKKKIEITPNLETLFGPKDENLYLIEDGLNVSIDLQSDGLEIEGTKENVARAEQVFADFEHLRRTGYTWHNGDLAAMLKVVIADPTASLKALAETGKQRAASGGSKRVVQPKSVHQKQYMEMIEQNDMVFGIGPAGTGKTYLAVAMAVSALLNKQVNRIVLARPAVEAGERLGFLPGTLQEKVDPYLRPLYDALYDLMESEKVDRFLEKNIIEIAPIAFMRGRTLNDAFIIMDEAQNTTIEQMKMFLTRMGNNSKAVITGDVTQIDLPNAKKSGLVHALDVLKGVKGIGFTHFTEEDVVRHHLVQRIIHAYERHKERTEQQLDLQLGEKIGSEPLSQAPIEQ